MSGGTMDEIVALQRKIRRQVDEGALPIDVEDLKQPEGLLQEASPEHLDMRVVIVRGFRLA